uniref:Uncharacterized protein n=1 Tax=Arundo donax TaxID=35708 RepID=A0A0A9GFJ8_ARUDO
MMHSGYGYLDLVFFFGRGSSAVARYDSTHSFSCASFFLNSLDFFFKDLAKSAISLLSLVVLSDSDGPAVFSFGGTNAASLFLLFSLDFPACFSSFSCHFFADLFLSLMKYSPVSSSRSILLGC